MIFLFPLVLSLIGAAFFFLTADVDLPWRLVAVALALAAAGLQFFTATTPFVPVATQIVLCIWFVIYWQMDSFRT